jgi:inosine-uridine nucleoside N-ribohydrolase
MRSTTKSKGLREVFAANLLVLIGVLPQTIALAGTSIARPADQKRSAPVNVIFDTDMWSDIDDALALAMLHALQDREEINLLAVTISTDDQWCAPYVDLVNTFYDHPQIPIGIVRGGMNTESFRKLLPNSSLPGTRYTQHVSERKNKDNTWVYPHELTGGKETPEAVKLLREVLSRQTNGSVVMIQVGYSTNFARLLESRPDALSDLSGRELVAKKVRLLSIMAGNFGETTVDGKTLPKGSPEFNLQADVSAAQRLFANWPTPIVASGFEIGLTLLYPRDSIEHDYAYVQNHPIAETYRFYCEEQNASQKWRCPHEHATFDLTSVLYAARPDRHYFSLSDPGKITIRDDGSSKFEYLEGGRDRYLILNEKQKARTLEAMVMLASQPPRAALGPGRLSDRTREPSSHKPPLTDAIRPKRRSPPG